MTPREWDEYQARVVAYVRRHGYPALLKAWCAKTRAEDTPNSRALLAHHGLHDEIREAWEALYEDVSG